MPTAGPMRILLVEDDLFKQEKIEATIREVHDGVSLSVARSVQQAVRRLREAAYDRIVLDMALPSHESRRGSAQPASQPSGGIEVLLELAYDERTDPVVIVTQYDEIEYDGKFHSLARARRALVDLIGANVVDVVYFDPQSEAWSVQLRKALA